ncbi:MAG: DUF362 domain-containing protein [Chloroflexota bacterium]
MAKRSMVRIAKGEDRVETALRYVGDDLARLISHGDRVLLKINQVFGFPQENGATVTADLVKAIALLAREAGARAVGIADDPGRYQDTMRIFQGFGTDVAAREVGAQLIDLKQMPHPATPVPGGGLVMEEIEFAAPLLEWDVLIGITKLKTHHQTVVTAALKNMFGAVPDHSKRFFHRRDLEKGIVDINTVRHPDYTIVDAFPAMEGLGPHAGTPVPLNLTLAGADPVAVDAVGASIMGFDPRDIRTIRLAGERGLGVADLSRIDVEGNSIDTVARPFRTALSVIQEKASGYIRIADHCPCSGCTGVVGSAVMVLLRAYGQDLDRFKGSELHFGNPSALPDLDDERVFLVGNCVEGCRDHPRFIPGCPPTLPEVMAWLSPMDVPLTLWAKGVLPRDV